MTDGANPRGLTVHLAIEPLSLPEAWFLPSPLCEPTYLFSMTAMTLGFSLRTQGRTHVPRKGQAILFANHQSHLDPLLVGLSSRPHLCFLTRITPFRNPFFPCLIRNINATPIDQQAH